MSNGYHQRMPRTIFVLIFLLSSSLFGQPESFSFFRQARDKGELAKALSIAEEGTQKTADNADRRLFELGRAITAIDLQDWAKAEESLQKLITSKSNLEEYAHYFYAQMLLKQGKASIARVQLQKVLDLSPNLRLKSEAQYEMALIALSDKNYRQARNILAPLERKQRREENHSEILYQLARAEKGMNNSAGFCKGIRKLYSQHPEFEPLNNWGPYLSENLFEGAPTRCISTMDETRSRFRNLLWAGMLNRANSEIQVLRTRKLMDKIVIDKLEAQVLLQEGEVSKALDILLPLFSQLKNDFQYLVLLSNASARAGEAQAAVGSYYSAYKLSPGSKTGRQALYQAAFLSYQFQDYDGAARRFQEFIKRYPTSGLSRDAKWHLAWIQYLKGDYSGAYRAFNELKAQKVSRRKNVSPISQDRITYWVAMSLYKQGQFEQARSLFEALAKDQLMGYYSMAAQSRLSKIDATLPKLAKKAQVSTHRMTRMMSAEFMMPSDDWRGPVTTSEETESEESLVAATPSTESEDQPVAEETTENEPTVEAPTKVPGLADDEEKVTSFSNPVLVRRFERARDLMIVGLYDWAKWDLYDIERKTSNREYLKTLMGEYERVDNFNRSSYIGQVYFGQQRSQYGIEGVRYLWEHAYPKAYAESVFKYAKNFSVPQEMIWAIMRAESQYKKDILSPAGAMGLMQVMPHTGQRVSESLNEKGFEPKKLYEPETAIKIGSRYLQRLMRKFDGNVALVAAGYNAGPHRVKSWLASFGQLDMDEFVEHIPFLETRNYVKKVLSNYQVYAKLYSGKKENVFDLSRAIEFRSTEPIPTKETWEDI